MITDGLTHLLYMLDITNHLADLVSRLRPSCLEKLSNFAAFENVTNGNSSIISPLL